MPRTCPIRLINPFYPPYNVIFWSLEQDVPRFTFGWYDTISLPVEPKFESIQLDPKLARTLNPTEIRPGVAVATLTGNLVVKNNK